MWAPGCFVDEDLFVPLVALIWGLRGTPEGFFGETLPNCLVRLDSYLPEEGWLIGEHPCWAEFKLFVALDCLKQIFGVGLLDTFPVLHGFCVRMEQRPGVQQGLSENRASRPVTFCPQERQNCEKIVSTLREQGLLPPTPL
mmetsp:Transcript_401/g.1237  ORF Transcript_401/g.1237 Transcript_401/m.1237 type:complete len:141 (-) Transcript_401:376-798(-)